uniref:Uncharacterized protein n=1 Tax=Dromaius novaehollandiae TaxID=8790 RepID=A0A8C4JBG9_DRONO
MRWPGVSLCGLLWMWLPLSCGRPVKIDKVKADTKNLARTLIARIQELQARPRAGRRGGDPGVTPVLMSLSRSPWLPACLVGQRWLSRDGDSSGSPWLGGLQGWGGDTHLLPSRVLQCSGGVPALREGTDLGLGEGGCDKVALCPRGVPGRDTNAGLGCDGVALCSGGPQGVKPTGM